MTAVGFHGRREMRFVIEVDGGFDVVGVVVVVMGLRRVRTVRAERGRCGLSGCCSGGRIGGCVGFDVTGLGDRVCGGCGVGERGCG